MPQATQAKLKVSRYRGNPNPPRVGMSKDLPVTIYAGFFLVGMLGIATLTSMAMGRPNSYDACVVEAVEGAHSEKEFREAIEKDRCRDMEAKAEAGEAVMRALFD